MPNNPDGNVHIGFFNIGMGDCTVIKGPKGEIGIIDCGSTNFGNTRIEDVKNEIEGFVGRSIEEVDFVLVTHSDSDHYNQLGELLGSTTIHEFYHADLLGAFSNNDFRRWIHGSGKYAKKMANIKKIIPITVNATKKPSILLKDWTKGTATCKIHVLASNVDVDSIVIEGFEKPKKAYRTNTLSAVVKITSASAEWLIAGDATSHTEKFLTDNKSGVLKSDVIRVGHHGSGSSSSDNFVKEVDPKIAVISSAENNSHHLPLKSVVYKWKAKTLDNTSHPIFHYDDLDKTKKVENTTKQIQITGMNGSQLFKSV